MTADDAAKVCAGCGKPDVEMQCPLCQAIDEDAGFFCSQACFAQNFVAHRDAAHKSGVVRAKVKPTPDDAASKRTRVAGAKRDRDGAADGNGEAAGAAAKADAEVYTSDDFSDDEEREAYRVAKAKDTVKRTELVPWPIVPSMQEAGRAVATAGSSGPFLSTPPVTLSSSWARVDVTASSAVAEEAALPAALFAVQFAADVLPLVGKTGRVLIVAGSATTAHIAAWCARCRRIPCVVACSTADVDLKQTPTETLKPFNPDQRRIVIVSSAVLVRDDAKPGSSASLWLEGEGSVLVALPDVPLADAEDMQSTNARALFVSYPSGTAAAAAAAASPAPKKGKKAAAAAAASTPVINALASVADAKLDLATHEKGTPKFDAQLSTMLAARGDLQSAVHRISTIYGASRTRAEDVLYGGLICDWGAASALHAHHKLAVLLRTIIDASVKLGTSAKIRDTNSLAHVAARCVVRAAKHLPRIEPPSATPGGRTFVPLYLDATLTYCYPHMPRATVDELAAAWGLTKLGVVPGPKALAVADKLRNAACHRIRSHYAAKAGTLETSFLLTLSNIIADASRRHSLTVRDVADATLWGYAVEPLHGPLEHFLAVAQLVFPPAELQGFHKGKMTSAAKISKTQLKKKPVVDISYVNDSTLVRVHPTATAVQLKRLEWPLLGARRRRVKLNTSMALDELLAAMPSHTIPMFIGDVGKLIGAWTRFNARFGTLLPLTLQAFLEDHPEHFTVVGTLVSRNKESKTAQIKMRYDNDPEEADSDDERGKSMLDKLHRSEKGKIKMEGIRTRRGLKAAEDKLKNSKSMSKRASKKRLKQLRNQARYNKNQKGFDHSAKVPGYDKPKGKKVKGRGRKANVRSFGKREAH